MGGVSPEDTNRGPGAGVEGPAPCPAGTALLFAPLGLKAVQQALELLFSQVYLILQLPLLDDQG